MDIHKPKPWHGLREFLKEYAIIVVGVLTALGAEQLVETLHWQEKVERGKAHETTELTSIYDTADERVTVESCLDRRLAQLSAALLAGDGKWTPLAPMAGRTYIGDRAYFAPARNWGEESWKTLVADGAANHLSDNEELLYSRIYAEVATIRAQNGAEAAAWDDLGLLQVPAMLSRTERNDLIRQVGRLQAMNHRMALYSRQVMGNIDKVAKVDKTNLLRLRGTNSNTAVACVALGLAPRSMIEPPAAGAPKAP